MTNQEINQARVDKHCTHFNLSEFDCRCSEYGTAYCDGHPDTINEYLLSYMEIIRAHFGGKAVHPTSCLRCPTHNAQPYVGGVSTSKHLSGLACDFWIEDTDQAEVQAFCETLPLFRYAYPVTTGIGGITHLDVTYKAFEDDTTDAVIYDAFSADPTKIKIEFTTETFAEICNFIGGDLGISCDTTTISGDYYITDYASSGDQSSIRAKCASLGIQCEAYTATITTLEEALARIAELEALLAAK